MYKRIMSPKRKKRKVHKILTTSLKNIQTLPLTKISYANSPPKYKTTLFQNYFPFLSRMTKDKSPRGHHLIIIGRVSILILILIIIVNTIITILICRSLRRRRGRSSETTKASLSLCNTTNTGVHLTQLITKSVKVSIHALKLCCDGLKSHTTIRGRRSDGGRNSRSCRISRLYSWPFRSKLGLASLNRSCADGTHDSVIRRIRNRDRKMAKDPHDSRRKNELITGRCILININDGSDEVRGIVNRKIL